MTTTLTAHKTGEVVRPLKVLVPLIKADFEKGDQAGMAYYQAAGEKLNEAREGHFEGDTSGFFKWAEKTFGKKRDAIRLYMASASTGSRKPFTTLDNLREKGLGHQPRHGYADTSRVYREWTAPVDAVAERARAEQLRLQRDEEMTRRQEREAESKLGLKLIEIGYKVLARELHPDAGGSREAMARLNRVRDRLKASI